MPTANSQPPPGEIANLQVANENPPQRREIKLRKNEMKLPKNRIISPRCHFVPPWRFATSSGAIGRFLCRVLGELVNFIECVNHIDLGVELFIEILFLIFGNSRMSIN